MAERSIHHWRLYDHDPSRDRVHIFQVHLSRMAHFTSFPLHLFFCLPSCSPCRVTLPTCMSAGRRHCEALAKLIETRDGEGVERRALLLHRRCNRREADVEDRRAVLLVGADDLTLTVVEPEWRVNRQSRDISSASSPAVTPKLGDE